MKDPIEGLQQLGFSQYEAQAYVALLQSDPLSGYELAKRSGIPRPNVYNVLQKLEERGAAIRLDTPAGTRYAPVPPEELILRLGNRLKSSLDEAHDALRAVVAHTEYDHILNARGYPVLLDHARAMIAAAEKQLLLATWPEEAMALSTDLSHALERGVNVTTLCMAGCPQKCQACQGKVYRHQVASPYAARWLILIPDSAEVLAGEISPGGDSLAVRTRQKLLVDVSSWYIRNTIALAAILIDLGSRLQQLVTPETLDTLTAVGPNEQTGGWLEHMHHLLNLGDRQIEDPGEPA